MAAFSKVVLSYNTATPTATQAIPLDIGQTPFNVSVAIEAVSGGSMEEWRVQHTFDNVFDASVSASWFNHASVSARQAGKVDGNYAFPIRAVRLQAVSGSAGTSTQATLWVTQAG